MLHLPRESVPRSERMFPFRSYSVALDSSPIHILTGPRSPRFSRSDLKMLLAVGGELAVPEVHCGDCYRISACEHARATVTDPFVKDACAHIGNARYGNDSPSISSGSGVHHR